MATKTVYQIHITHTESSAYPKATFSYETKELRDTCFLEFVTGNKTKKDIQHIETQEQEVECGLVLETVFIAALISGEYHKQVMVKGLMDSMSAVRLLTEVAVECFKAFEFHVIDSGAEKTMEEMILSFAKSCILENYGIKI